ncbi:zwei Ig domain protein zig-4-like [Oppia nitens]|uniref:zwei Ig domain protein zig-4-like n=1 Tax=Oppia nitens TaxID=1686743 RepID=UPI0023DA319E|nr:zwei Ig domain protein zig-4-like [Oppia nitens]XP_054167056.1 zwei Ig domain protein zig-4-like [Oppia nitens]
MKKSNNNYSLGLFSSLINRLVIALMVCVILINYKPSEGRPRSNSAKNTFELFGRETRFSKELNLDKSTKSNKSYRNPYLRLREVPESEITATETSTHILQCEAGGTPTPTIHWLKNGNKIDQGDTGSYDDDDDNIKKGELSLSMTRSRLFLDCVHPKDEAIYTCVASSPANRVSAETHLKVIPNLRTSNDLINEDNNIAKCLTKKSYGSPARIHMWTHNILELIGSDVQLLCRASGTPTPTISWVGPEDNTLTNSEKYKILENGDLVIRDLSWDDMGNYMCVADNQHGSDRTTLFLYPTLPEDRK